MPGWACRDERRGGLPRNGGLRVAMTNPAGPKTPEQQAREKIPRTGALGSSLARARQATLAGRLDRIDPRRNTLDGIYY